MKRFTITDFQPLKDERLIDVLQRLRTLKTSWQGRNPVTELLKMRHEDGELESP